MNIKLTFVFVIVFALLFTSVSLALNQEDSVQFDVAQEDSQSVGVVEMSGETVPTPPIAVPITPITPQLPIAKPIDPNPPGSGGGSSGGSSGGSGSKKNNDDDEGGRRVLNQLPLTNLSGTSSDEQNPESEQSSVFSKITGAVIGVFGKRGTLGIGIFIVVLGIVGLAVYNRERFGIVKKAN